MTDLDDAIISVRSEVTPNQAKAWFAAIGRAADEAKTDWTAFQRNLRADIGSDGVTERAVTTLLDYLGANPDPMATVSRLNEQLPNLPDRYATLLTPQNPAEAAGQAPRYTSLKRVDGYTDWWLGYDSIDGGYKYIRSIGEPDATASGWMAQSEAFAAMQQPPDDPARAASRFINVQRVDGYADWWLGYDGIDGGYKYIRSTDQPAATASDWVTQAEAFTAMQQPAPLPAAAESVQAPAGPVASAVGTHPPIREDADVESARAAPDEVEAVAWSREQAMQEFNASLPGLAEELGVPIAELRDEASELPDSFFEGIISQRL